MTSKINETKDGLLIGYVRIKQFNANASREMKDTLQDLEVKLSALYGLVYQLLNLYYLLL